MTTLDPAKSPLLLKVTLTGSGQVGDVLCLPPEILVFSMILQYRVVYERSCTSIKSPPFIPGTLAVSLF